MKIKLETISLIIFTLALVSFLISLTSNNNQILANEIEFSNGLQIQGRLEATGTYFEIKDSEYLNIALKSSEEIKVVLESIPRMLSLDISSSTDFTSTDLTISGLEPNKTYYKYQDSYKQGAVFASDENGTTRWEQRWEQNLTQSHHIWLQEIKGTIFLPEDCSDYGNWNITTQTCTLTQDLNENIEITTDGIALDCNNHHISRPPIFL